MSFAFSSRQRWASAWFKAAFLSLGLGQPIFIEVLDFRPRSGSWNPEVNDFGPTAELFRPIFDLAASGLEFQLF